MPHDDYRDARKRVLRSLSSRHGKRATLRTLARVEAHRRSHRVTEQAAISALRQIAATDDLDPATWTLRPNADELDTLHAVSVYRMSRYVSEYLEQVPEQVPTLQELLSLPAETDEPKVRSLTAVAEDDAKPPLRQETEALVAAPRPGPFASVMLAAA